MTDQHFDLATALGQHPNYKPKRSMPRKKPQHHERNKVHIPMVKFLNRALDPETQMLWHTANEGQLPVRYRTILRAMGLLPGVPDLFLFTKPVGLVAMEAKRPGVLKLSDNQAAFKRIWTKQFPWITFNCPEQCERELRALGVPLRATLLDKGRQ